MTRAEATRELQEPGKCPRCDGAGHTGQDRFSGVYDPCDACEGTGAAESRFDPLSVQILPCSACGGERRPGVLHVCPDPEAVTRAIRTGAVCGTCADEGALTCDCWNQLNP